MNFTDQGSYELVHMSSFFFFLVSLSLIEPSFPVNLNQFRLLRVVGKGAFGKVRIVERKDTGLAFALKYICKEEGEQFSPSLLQRRNLATYSSCCSCPVGVCSQYYP